MIKVTLVDDFCLGTALVQFNTYYLLIAANTYVYACFISYIFLYQ